MITIVYDQEGDWMAVYKDGKLMLEGHSFSAPALLQVAGVQYAVIYDGDALATGARFPKDLADVVRA